MSYKNPPIRGPISNPKPQEASNHPIYLSLSSYWKEVLNMAMIAVVLEPAPKPPKNCARKLN